MVRLTLCMKGYNVNSAAETLGMYTATPRAIKKEKENSGEEV